MRPGLTLEVQWSDVDLVELEIAASNGTFAGGTRTYVTRGELHAMAGALRGFPTGMGDRREVGASSVAGSLRAIFETVDAHGHARVTVCLESSAQNERVVLALPVEPAGVDRFVDALDRLDTERRGSCAELESPVDDWRR